MSIELWIGKKFDTSYERKALDYFITDMESRFGNSDELHLVLADYYIDGRQVDLTVLKRDAIIVIELKECEAPFEASVNDDWLTPDGHSIGGQRFNPYQQIQQYRLKWVNFLQRNKHQFRCLATAQTGKPFWHVTGIVAICPSVHPKTQNYISNDSWWFELCGLDELSKLIGFQTNQWMEFTDDELRKTASELLSLKYDSNIQQQSITNEWLSREATLKKRIEADLRKKIEWELENKIEPELKAKNLAETECLENEHTPVRHKEIEESVREREMLDGTDRKTDFKKDSKVKSFYHEPFRRVILILSKMHIGLAILGGLIGSFTNNIELGIILSFFMSFIFISAPFLAVWLIAKIIK